MNSFSFVITQISKIYDNFTVRLIFCLKCVDTGKMHFGGVQSRIDPRASALLQQKVNNNEMSSYNFIRQDTKCMLTVSIREKTRISPILTNQTSNVSLSSHHQAIINWGSWVKIVISYQLSELKVLIAGHSICGVIFTVEVAL